MTETVCCPPLRSQCVKNEVARQRQGKQVNYTMRDVYTTLRYIEEVVDSQLCLYSFITVNCVKRG